MEDDINGIIKRRHLWLEVESLVRETKAQEDRVASEIRRLNDLAYNNGQRIKELISLIENMEYNRNLMAELENEPNTEEVTKQEER